MSSGTLANGFAPTSVGDRPTRVAIIVSHPIQHFTPFYRILAREPGIELRVFFCSRIGVDEYYDTDFGQRFRWDSDLLQGVPSEFLAGAERIKHASSRSVNNPDVERRLATFAPDVVQVYGYNHVTTLRAIRWCRRNGVPVLMKSDSELRHERSAAVRLLKRLVLPPLLRRIDGFLTAGDGNEEYLRSYGASEDRLFRSPLPIDEDAFLEARASRETLRRQVRLEWHVEQDAFVLLFVGKLIARKRPQDLVSAVARLPDNVSNIRAVFVGDGELRRQLEQQTADANARERCRFVGFVNQRALPRVYAGADAVVHPSSTDPHPLAVTEGVLMGLPIIASDRIGSVGPSDTARPGFNAIVYPCTAVAALAEAIVRLASDPDLARRMGRASEAVAEETGVTASLRGYLQAVRAVTRMTPVRS